VKDNYVVALAICCLTTLEVVALLKGIDGSLFGLIVATIAGLAGYQIRGWKDAGKRR
jgi:hypothetical protein